MANQKQRRSCRSKSVGSQSGGEPATPISNSQTAQLKGRRSRSPAHVSTLPLNKNKNTDGKDVALSEVGQTMIPSMEESDIQSSDILKEAGQTETPSNVVNVTLEGADPPATPLGVGDNGGNVQYAITDDVNSGQSTLNLAKVDPGRALLLVLAELKDIKSQMAKLHELESTTASLVGQLATNTSKVGELVETVTQNKSKIQEINTEMGGLKEELNSHTSQLANLKQFKEDINESTDKTVAKMNELIDTQRDQVDSFNAGAKQLQKEWKREVMSEVNKKFEELEKEKYYKSLKDQAFRNRFNLVLVGAQEETEKTTSQIVKNLFTEVLKIPKVRFTSAVRLGSQSETPTSYNRPILIKFSNWGDRNTVWRIRSELPDKRVRIQADLPKVLREGIPTLYKVANAASKSKEFNNVRVQNYQLELNGKPYQISDLEQLPYKFRPSTLAEPKSETHMVFFSRHSKLSNHHPAKFTIKGQDFESMEQFLAIKRAELSGREDLIKKARESQDAVQAKHVLNELHGDHQQEWEEGLERTALEGLRAKFSQNRPLQEHLCGTGKLVLGEASTNMRWGIGMDINNEEVLDHSKWAAEGNLLGRTLMTLRSEFQRKKKKANR